MTKGWVNGKRIVIPITRSLNITFPVSGKENDFGSFHHQTLHRRRNFPFSRVNVTIVKNPQKGLFPIFSF